MKGSSKEALKDCKSCTIPAQGGSAIEVTTGGGALDFCIEKHAHTSNYIHIALW